MENREIIKAFLKILQKEADMNIVRDVQLEALANQKVIIILGSNNRANSWLINNLINKNRVTEIWVFGENIHVNRNIKYINPQEVQGFASWNNYCKANEIDSIIFFNSSPFSLDAYYTEEVLANINIGVENYMFITETYELCRIQAKQHLKTITLYNDIINWFINTNLLKNEIKNKKIEMMTKRNQVIGESEYIGQALEVIKRELLEM